ncbi:Uncharacterised protein [Mannheimia haemolytica]|uniref:Uncharacterized protein n=1 Tax=Mannheimia haemolytica TaxID=75985 RepID=A0A378MV44_MANHA|nr:Uncharacterised protein [Mannheimia haemolytica]
MQLTSNQYINDIKHILLSARQKAYQSREFGNGRSLLENR